MSYLLAALGEVLTAKIMVLMGIGTIVGVIRGRYSGSRLPWQLS